MTETALETQPDPASTERPREARPKKRDVHGWVILDKPVGMTSTFAVAVVKRAFAARKAGHAGTLDPLASGLLPIALGEATKTVPFVMDGRKSYEFRVIWGVETTTDDAEGSASAISELRPQIGAIEALLPEFTGTIWQVPPKFSAIKIAGERAYDLARDGEEVTLEARTVEIDALRIVGHDGATTTFEAECGKGTYVRAIARDLGRRLGCYGHVGHLRRTRVGPFSLNDSVLVETLRESLASAETALRPVASALAHLPEIAVHRDAALRLRRGQSVLVRGREPIDEGASAYATCAGLLIATGTMVQGELVPHRVFNL